MIQVVGKSDLMELIGYSETQAGKLIRRLKAELVQKDLNGIRINVLDVPIITVESILSFQIQLKNDN